MIVGVVSWKHFSKPLLLDSFVSGRLNKKKNKTKQKKNMHGDNS